MDEADYRNLADQIIDTKSVLEHLPPQLVGPRYYFHMALRPKRTGAKEPLHRLIERTALSLVGSRGNGAESAVTLMVSARTEGLDQLLYTALDAGHLPKSIRSGFNEIAAIAAPRCSDILAQRPHEGGAWDCVLHPSGGRVDGAPSPVGDVTFGKWCVWIEHLGGEVVSKYRRPLRGLTYVPMRLPSERLVEAARFNPLRSVRPLARVGLRSALGGVGAS